jgi:hypothetical protein
MKVTLTLQEEVREASMENLMDQQQELNQNLLGEVQRVLETHLQ